MKKEDLMKIYRSKHTEALSGEQEKFYDGMADAVLKIASEEADTRKAEIDNVLRKLGTFDEEKSAAEVIRSMGQKISDLENRQKQGLAADDRYALRRKLEEKKDDIKRALAARSPWSLEFRARRDSALMTNATVLTGATAINSMNIFDDMDVAVVQYPKNFILDAISARQVEKVPEYMRWKEETANGGGAVAVTAEGVEKPLVDYKFVWKNATRKKYAGRIEFTEEMQMDLEQLYIRILSMFEDQVLRAWHDGVLADVIAWAPAYTSSSLDGKIVAPSVYHVIGAMKAQIAANNYNADVLVMNPGDAALALYLQDNNGSQQFIPESLQFGGLQPFITNSITSGNILVGQRSIVKEQHGSLIIRNGQYGNQLIENEYTVIGEVFSILQLPTISKNSWCYDAIGDVEALLTKIDEGALE